MDQRLGLRLRLFVVIATLAIVTLAFHFAGTPVTTDFGGLISAVPVAMAAWLLGGRIAIAVAIVESIANVGLNLGTTVSIEDTMSNVAESAVLCLLAISATAARRAERRLVTVLATDSVTGLANRQALLNEVDRLLTRDASVTIGMLDLIDVAEVNDALGYEVGDELLLAVATRLRDAFGPSTFIAKGIRDRFAVIWPAPDSSDEPLANKLLAIVEEPFVISGAVLHPRARVSITRSDTVGAHRANEMTRAALKALERAARDGRPWLSADRPAPTPSISRLELLSDLSRAITNDELRLHYQPIVELPSTRVSGVEALVRWQHPERGLLAPGEFIPLAEQSGLIVPLTKWVLDEALRQSKAWSDAGQPIRIAVNVGAKSLTRSALLPSLVGKLLSSHAVDAELLVLEVTESDIMTDPEQAIACLRELKALGVRLEIDDFGTGYSSLAYLQKLPLDAVKIDRSFITPLFVDAGTSAIARATIELSHALGLETIAEGVEDQSVVEMLGAMGCDFAQGFVFARPMAADKLIGWLASHANYQIPAPASDITTEPVAASGGPSRTVLVVDDEHPFRISAHRILTAQGFNVLHAATASEALRLCATHRGDIDLVLTDLFLTDWQGHKLATHLKQMYPELRVMFMSGDPSGKQLVGQDTFLAKPFSRQQLVACVSLALAS